MFTFDYAQNLYLPNYSKEKPESTYYFLPLNLHVFRLVNCSPEKDHLCRFSYYEEQGKKRGDNTGSLVTW